MKNNSINHFDNIIYDNNILKDDQNITSSMFTYYNGKINVTHKNHKNSFNTKLTKGFTNVLQSKKIYIIDFANIIHILYNHYHNTNKVITVFYTFIYKRLLLDETIFIVSKNVTIPKPEVSFNIENVFNIGKKITNLIISNTYFENEKLNIYDLHYPGNYKISSSTDDLLTHFICFNIFVYLFKNNKNPEKKIIMMTNDKQYLDKNLFGITYDEENNHIKVYKDVVVKKLIFDYENEQYKLVINSFDELLIKNFYKDYVITRQDDNKDMECIIILFIELLLNYHRKNKIYTGQYLSTSKNIGANRKNRNSRNNINKNFTRKNFINKTTQFSYNELNKLFKKNISHKNIEFQCMIKNIKNVSYNNGNIKKIYYLYTYFKYVQSFLHKTNVVDNKTKILYDFYGNYDNDIIINIITNV